jgi:hypothetical protein
MSQQPPQRGTLCSKVNVDGHTISIRHQGASSDTLEIPVWLSDHNQRADARLPRFMREHGDQNGYFISLVA